MTRRATGSKCSTLTVEKVDSISEQMIYIDGVRGGTMYDIYGQCDTLLNQRSHYNYANIMNSTYPRNRPILGGFAYSLDSAPSHPLH